MTVNPSHEWYRSRTACRRHGTMNKLASSGQCVTCASLAAWKRRRDQAADKAAREAIEIAAENLNVALTVPPQPQAHVKLAGRPC
jgi:hypothetical protein